MTSKPLTPENVTRASRLMLPVHAIFATVLGFIWLLQPTHLGPGAALNALNDLWSVHTTAWVLVVLALLEWGAIFLGNRTVESLLLAGGAVVFSGIGVLLVIGHVPNSSYSAPFWPWYVAIAHVASLVSVVFGENRELAE